MTGNDPDSPFFGLHYADKPLPEPDMAVTADGDAVVARYPTHDCMFHDEGIPDAPCICRIGKPVEGSHEIVAGEVLPVHDESHPPPRDAGENHVPRRGSDVEAWLRSNRENFDKTSTYGGAIWMILDHILDDYRLAADMGMSLDEIADYDGPR